MPPPWETVEGPRQLKQDHHATQQSPFWVFIWGKWNQNHRVVGSMFNAAFSTITEAWQRLSLHQGVSGPKTRSSSHRMLLSQERGEVLHQPRERGGPAVCTNKGVPEGIVQSEKRQAEKDKYHAISLFVKSKKVQLLETESRRLVSRD